MVIINSNSYFIIDLRQKSSKELVFAASSSLRSEGNPKAARILSEVVQNPDHVQNLIRAHEKRKNISAEMNTDKALAIYLDCELTKEKYKRLRINTLDEGKSLVYLFYMNNFFVLKK